jgi:hypothetical protein
MFNVSMLIVVAPCKYKFYPIFMIKNPSRNDRVKRGNIFCKLARFCALNEMVDNNGTELLTRVSKNMYPIKYCRI